jgi:hypothetical protein
LSVQSDRPHFALFTRIQDAVAALATTFATRDIVLASLVAGERAATIPKGIAGGSTHVSAIAGFWKPQSAVAAFALIQVGGGRLLVEGVRIRCGKVSIRLVATAPETA